MVKFVVNFAIRVCGLEILRGSWKKSKRKNWETHVSYAKPHSFPLFPFVYWANTLGRVHPPLARDFERDEATEQNSPAHKL